MMIDKVNWEVTYSNKARRQLKKIPVHIQHAAGALQAMLEEYGPIQKEWKHFGLLDKKKWNISLLVKVGSHNICCGMEGC